MKIDKVISGVIALFSFLFFSFFFQEAVKDLGYLQLIQLRP